MCTHSLHPHRKMTHVRTGSITEKILNNLKTASKKTKQTNKSTCTGATETHLYEQEKNNLILSTICFTHGSVLHKSTKYTHKRKRQRGEKIPVQTLEKCYRRALGWAQTNEVTKDEVSTLLAFTLSLFCVICVCPKCTRVFCFVCSSCFLVHHYFVILTRFIKNNENTDMWMLYIPPKCVTDVSLLRLHPRFKYCTRFVFIKT